jgi:hypothetical protein
MNSRRLKEAAKKQKLINKAYKLRVEFNQVRIEYSITNNPAMLKMEEHIRNELCSLGYSFIFYKS